MLIILMLTGLAGCTQPQPFVTPERLDRGLVLVLTGIEGASRINEDICWGLADAGVHRAIELVDWTMPGAYLHNLRDQERNRKKAEDIANRITRYQMSHPDRPVTLIGHSGGGAMAVWIAEAMSPDSSIDGLILLSASLSPGYLLDISLRNSRQGIVSFFSREDWFFLGAGTMTLGTMDGKHTSSAGMVGFDVPARPGQEGLYGKVFQIAWQKRMARTGHTGGHPTSGARRFVATYVAPLVLAENWDKATIKTILSDERTATCPTTTPK
ncbi:MAG: alpha/beta hydrolase [Phycisphaerae bacterium]|nr:alpha/beta hydrolase [Phycisphaerae bacterium]